MSCSENTRAHAFSTGPCCSVSGFIAFSTNPKLAKRIKTFYALAPVATVKYTETLLNKLMLVPSFLFKVCDSL